jgi:hypothetical protein
MVDMWKSRSPPTPLDFDAILNGSYSPNNAKSVNDSESNSVNGRSSGSNQAQVLKDQRALTLKDNLDLFISRYFVIMTGISSVLITHEALTVLLSDCAMARKQFLLIKMTTTR